MTKENHIKYANIVLTNWLWKTIITTQWKKLFEMVNKERMWHMPLSYPYTNTHITDILKELGICPCKFLRCDVYHILSTKRVIFLFLFCKDTLEITTNFMINYWVLLFAYTVFYLVFIPYCLVEYIMDPIRKRLKRELTLNYHIKMFTH